MEANIGHLPTNFGYKQMQGWKVIQVFVSVTDGRTTEDRRTQFGSLKPASHCAISCGAMSHRKRLPDIVQCERFCDAIAGDFSTIASNRLASRDFELVQKFCCNQSDDMRSLAVLRWIFGGPRKGRRFPSKCGGISACQPITIA